MQGKVSSKPNAAPVYVGVDVCKEWLDIHLHPLGRDLRLVNGKAGLQALKRLLRGLQPALIAMEATGKFHRLAHRGLHESGFPVAIVDPYRARMFARACGHLAKTDRLDARFLAILAQMQQPAPTAPPDKLLETLGELVNARSAAAADLTAHKNRLKATDSDFLRKQLGKLVMALQRHIESLDKEIALRITDDPELCRRVEILTSVPGVGTVTAYSLIVGLSELGQCNAKQAAMLAGLAPIANDSGARQGQRSIRGGRKAPRNALYMAALSACRYNPDMKIFATRLKDRGKQAKVVLTAVMRKLVVLANTLLAENRCWTPNPP